MAFGFSYSFSLSSQPDETMFHSFMDTQHMEREQRSIHELYKYSMSYQQKEREKPGSWWFPYGTVITVLPIENGCSVKLTSRFISGATVLLMVAILAINLSTMKGFEFTVIGISLVLATIPYLAVGTRIYIAGRFLEKRINALSHLE